MPAPTATGILKQPVYWNWLESIPSGPNDMADLSPAPTRRPTLGSGIAAVLGLFAGLCAIFAGVVTLIDFHAEVTQARWPMASAVVDRADVEATARGPDNGSGTRWNLRVRVRFEADGQARTATLAAPVAFSESEAEKLQAWAAEHPRGRPLYIRYDPSRPNRAIFASSELSTDHTRTDLILLSVLGVACAVLLTLARFLMAHPERAAPPAVEAARARLAIGLFVAGLGLLMTALVLNRAIHADPFVAENLMGVPLSLVFLLAGILVVLPPGDGKRRSLLTALLLTCFALTFDWVAFGPGERHFTGSAGGVGFIPSEWMGRAAFGAVAVVSDILAIRMWIGLFRQGSIHPGASTI
jgi:hypothetical protein